MSDELDIRSGGVIAVDTATLREAADRYARIGDELGELERRVRSAVLMLVDVGRSAAQLTSSAEYLAGRVDAASADAAGFADRLRFAAAVYEVVELRAAAEQASHSADRHEADRLQRETDARLEALSREYWWAGPTARLTEAQRWLTWPGALAVQGLGLLPYATMIPGGMLGVSATALAIALGIRSVGGGTIPAHARLAPAVTPVRVTPVAGPVTVPAPATLAEAAERIPGGSGPGRVRVETYTMDDSSKQYVVYVTGTREFGVGGDEPFDMASNVELYSGTRSASYEATVAALHAAGAGPGDVVHAVGHSQGAMVNAHLALEGGFDTRTVVSFGPPVEADLGERTLSVEVRHSDDPVVGLEAGGYAHAVGAPGSFVAERVADPMPGIRDLQLPSHGMDVYTETARMLDDSTDPRMRPVRDLFEELATAESVEVTEYSAERVSPADVGAAGSRRTS